MAALQLEQKLYREAFRVQLGKLRKRSITRTRPDEAKAAFFRQLFLREEIPTDLPILLDPMGIIALSQLREEQPDRFAHVLAFTPAEYRAFSNKYSLTIEDQFFGGVLFSYAYLTTREGAPLLSRGVAGSAYHAGGTLHAVIATQDGYALGPQVGFWRT